MWSHSATPSLVIPEVLSPLPTGLGTVVPLNIHVLQPNLLPTTLLRREVEKEIEKYRYRGVVFAQAIEASVENGRK